MKKVVCITLLVALLLGLCACGSESTKPSGSNGTAAAATASGKTDETQPATEETTPETEAPSETAAATEAPTETTVGTEAPSDTEKLNLNVYSLKGPTSMGIVTLLEDSKNGLTSNDYVSTVCTGADEVTAALVNETADIALLPANAAAALYNKNGGFRVVAINTLGVLYVVENGESIQSIEDLAGKTVCMTGKGTTPEYALRYLLAAHGIEDQVTLEFKSEAQEVVAAMSEDVAMIGLLPQPFVTAAMSQNEKLRLALNLTEEWGKVSTDSSLVTGVTVVRTEVLESHPEAIACFLEEARLGVEMVNAKPEVAAPLIEALGIVAKAPLAQKAIPFCNLVCITGNEMKTTLSGYLQTLFDQNPKAVGGQMPADDFYYTGE